MTTSGKRFKTIAAASLLLVLIVSAVFAFVRSGGIGGSATTAAQESWQAPEEQTGAGQTVPVSLKLPLSAESRRMLDGMEPVLASESLQLYVDRKTAEIAVLDKRNGKVWRSNPPDREKDSLATPYVKGKLSSQLSLVYLSGNGQTKEFDSFNDSVQYNQFEIKPEDGGVVVTYHFGKDDKGIESIPASINKQRFEENLLGKLTEQKDKRELQSRYKLSEDGTTYIRRDLPTAAITKLIAILEKVGYTEEDLAFDNKENGIEGGVGAGNAKFTAAVRYALDGDELLASVDTRNIEESQAYRIHTIGLLEHFGAAGKQVEGYMFVPDGSGALIRLNNGRVLSQPVVVPIYGEDGSIVKDDKPFTAETNRMPVFGMKKGDEAYFAVIEQGDALAQLTADIGGKQHEYNSIAAKFTILPKDKLRLNEREELVRTPSEPYRGKLQIRYSFLYEDKANYSGMAAYYRGYLEHKYGLKKVDSQGDAPFYMELIGTIPKTKSFLGIPYEAQVPLSDFTQSSKLVDELDGKQVRNIRLLYSGWFNGGVRHKLPWRIRMNGELGSREEWQSLVERVKQTGGALYPDVAFLEVYQDGSGFDPSEDAAQFLTRKIAKVYDYDPVTFRKNRMLFSHYNLSPGKLDAVIDGFLHDYGKLGMDAVSLRDLGSDIHSDFRLSQTINRQEAKQINEKELERIQKAAPDLMVNGGNAFSLKYAKHLVNLPQTSSMFQIADESVPFAQMVLHGYVEYAGKPYNYADDQDLRTNVLRSLETGSNVYYRWICADPSELNETASEDLYAVYYKTWFDEAVKAYEEVNAVLRQVRGQTIVAHEKLGQDVYRTTYENGKSVTVNYGKKAISVGGITVGAESYAVGG